MIYVSNMRYDIDKLYEEICKSIQDKEKRNKKLNILLK